MNNKLVDQKKGRMLFILCWLVYFSSYIGRLNYSSVMSSIVEENILTFSQAGTISMVYFFAYGTGQFCNGILGDKIKPQKMIFTGLFVSGIANVLMGITAAFGAMVVLWGINGYMQSMIWPPIIRIFAEKYTNEKKKKYSIDIASSMAIGTLMSYFLSACAMKFFSWHAAFYLAACIMIVIAFVWIKGYGKIEEFQKDHVVYEEEKNIVKATVDEKQVSFFSVLIGSGLLLVVLPVMIHGILKDGVTQWVPTYIYENFEVTASFSVIVTMILPIVNLTGAYMARFVDKIYPKQEVKSACWFFGCAVVSLLLLLGLGKYHVLLSVTLFAIVTACMMAVNTLFVNLLPLHFENQGRVSSVSGFLNSVAYIGSAISTFTIGVMVEHVGWNATMLSWIGITAVAFILCLLIRKKDFYKKGR